MENKIKTLDHAVIAEIRDTYFKAIYLHLKSIEDVVGEPYSHRSRKRGYLEARSAAMVAIAEYFQLVPTARAFGKHHASVIHARDKGHEIYMRWSPSYPALYGIAKGIASSNHKVAEAILDGGIDSMSLDAAISALKETLSKLQSINEAHAKAAQREDSDDLQERLREGEPAPHNG